jgi:hypothetical protein
MVVPLEHGAPPIMAQVSFAEPGIFVPYRLPVAGLSFSYERKTTGERDSLRLIFSGVFSLYRALVMHELLMAEWPD